MNFRKKLKTFADNAKRVVESTPGIKEAAESIAEKIAGKIDETLHRSASGRKKAARSTRRDSEQPTAAGMAAKLFKNIPPIPIEVSEARLNQLARDAIVDDSRIESLKIHCQRDCITVSGTLRLAGVALNFTTRLALHSCELSPSRKVITLRRLDDIVIGGTGMLASFMAHVAKIVICGFFGVDLAAISLGGINGLTINKDLITADLEAMGAVEGIVKSLREKLRQRIELLPIWPLVKIVVEPILDGAGPLLLSRLHLQKVAVTDRGIQGSIVLRNAGRS